MHPSASKSWRQFDAMKQCFEPRLGSEHIKSRLNPDFGHRQLSN